LGKLNKCTFMFIVSGKVLVFSSVIAMVLSVKYAWERGGSGWGTGS